MRSINKIGLVVFSLVLFFSAGTMSARAQTDDPNLLTCEQIADKAKRLEIERDSLKAQLGIEQTKVSVERERSALLAEQRDFYKAAYEKMGKVDTNSQMVIDNLRVQVNDFRMEVADLRRENDKLRDSRTIRTALGFGAGLGTGIWLKSKN